MIQHPAHNLFSPFNLFSFTIHAAQVNSSKIVIYFGNAEAGGWVTPKGWLTRH
jgi:hypothetical protein